MATIGALLDRAVEAVSPHLGVTGSQQWTDAGAQHLTLEGELRAASAEDPAAQRAAFLRAANAAIAALKDAGFEFSEYPRIEFGGDASVRAQTAMMQLEVRPAGTAKHPTQEFPYRRGPLAV